MAINQLVDNTSAPLGVLTAPLSGRAVYVGGGVLSLVLSSTGTSGS